MLKQGLCRPEAELPDMALQKTYRSEGLARTRLFHPWGHEPEGGVVRLRRSVSHVVGQGHMLTSDWVPLGPVKARRGPMGFHMCPYRGHWSGSLVRARLVPSSRIG